MSNWNVEKAIQFDSMFSHSTFNGDVSNWKLSSTTNVQYMFVRAIEFEGIGVGTGDVSGVRGVEFENIFPTLFFSIEKLSPKISHFLDILEARDLDYLESRPIKV